MKSFKLIVAMDRNRGIGKDGQLPWHLPEDLKYFKQITTDTSSPDLINAVVMGRKTWESIPEKFRPLPDRLNIVLTRNKDYALPNNVLMAESIEELKSIVESQGQEAKIDKAFVIGGEQIFKMFLEDDSCDQIYLTQVNDSFECDTFFPPFEEHYTQIQPSEIISESNEQCSFLIFQKES